MYSFFCSIVEQNPPITEGVTRKGRTMARSEGTFAQAKHILGVIADAKPTKAQFDGLIGRSDLLKSLVEYGDRLEGVDKSAFVGLLLTASPQRLRERVNPFAGEKVEVAERFNDDHALSRSANSLSFAVHQFVHSLGTSGEDRQLRTFERSEKYRVLPEGADGWVSWPKLSEMGRILDVPDPYDLDYGTCLRRVMRALKIKRGATANEKCDGLNAVQLRPLPCIANLYREWESKTPGPYMYAPVQVGGLFAGHSVRNARWEMVHARQFPLDPYVAACLLLANSSLLYRSNTAMECPGATYAPRPDESPEFVLTFENSNMNPTMYMMRESYVAGGVRPASGFLPPSRKLKL